MFAMFTKSKELGLEVDVQLQLCDGLVKAIMLYGCEVWGFKHFEVLEKLHIKVCKTVLGDLGRLPIDYNVNSRIVGFWYTLISGSDNKMSSIFYKLIYSLHINFILQIGWKIL